MSEKDIKMPKESAKKEKIIIKYVFMFCMAFTYCVFISSKFLNGITINHTLANHKLELETITLRHSFNYPLEIRHSSSSKIEIEHAGKYASPISIKNY